MRSEEEKSVELRALEARQENDTATLIATIVGTFVISDYAQDEADEVWVRVRHAVDRWLEAKVR